MFVSAENTFSHSRRCLFRLQWQFTSLSVDNPFLLFIDEENKSVQIELSEGSGAIPDNTTVTFEASALLVSTLLKSRYWLQIYADIDSNTQLVYEGYVDITDDDAVIEQSVDFVLPFDGEEYLLLKEAAEADLTLPQVVAANTDQDTTTAFSRNTINCETQPQFVEIFYEEGQTYCRLANEYIHGVVLTSVPPGGIATITLPSPKIKGFSNLVPPTEYALDVPTQSIVEYDPESKTQLYIGYAVSDTAIEFPHDTPKKRKKDTTIPLDLICQAGVEAPDGDTPLDLICQSGKIAPPTGDRLIIGDLESASSSLSYYNTNLTTSGKRPVIAFSAKLNGVPVQYGSDLQYSIDAGATWHTCGKYGSGKHIAEGNVSSLPLMLAFSTPYNLVTRLSINTAVVSNTLPVTTGPEPDTEEEIDDDLRRYIVWCISSWGAIQENGLWEIAYDSGVRVLAPFELFHWSKYEQGLDNYNFEDLEYYLEKAANKGYQILLWGFPRHARPEAGPGGEWLWRRVSGGGWEKYYKNYHDSSYLPASSWERDRYGNIAGSQGYNFGVSSSFSFSDAYATERYLRLTAKIAHLINTGTVSSGAAAGKPYKEVVHAFGLLGGGYNETSFNLQYRVPNPLAGQPNQPNELEVAYEVIYSDASMLGYRIWLEFERHGNIRALNDSWGTSFANFDQINKDTISKPSEYGWGVGYTDNNATKDLFAFQVFQHATFYAAVNEAVKNPSSIIAGLSSDTGIKTACYVTENHTFAEGVRYGVAPLKTMYEDFDIHFSSTTAGNSPTYYSNNVLWDYALRAAEFAGTFGGTRFGQERDGDPVEWEVGYTKIFNVTKRYGARYQVVALQSTPKEWNSTDGIPLMQDTDGVWRTRKDSLKKLYETEFATTEHPDAPTFPGTLSFTERQALENSYDPNGIKDAFKNASNLDSNGVAASLVKVQVVKDIHLIDLLIETGSITYIAYTGYAHGVGFRAKINGQQVKGTTSVFTSNGYEFSMNGSDWFALLGKSDGSLSTGFPSSGAWVSGGTYGLRFRPSGVTHSVSNVVNVTIP